MLDVVQESGLDSIIFQIPDDDSGYDANLGVWTIKPLSALPQIFRDSTIIDDKTQAQFAGSDRNPFGPEIKIDGEMLEERDGLWFGNSHSALMHVTVNRFPYEQVRVTGDSCRMTGCYIVTDASGMNRYEDDRTGILVAAYDGAHSNIIGGPLESDRNVISGNGVGIKLIENCNYNQIINNYIGINRSGTDTLGNHTGIRLSSSNHTVIGSDNIISGNSGNGIEIMESDSCTILGNKVGTDPTGMQALGNGGLGIHLYLSSYNTIGGSLPGSENLFSGNLDSGISLKESHHNQIMGNCVGTNLQGTGVLGNSGQGIILTDSEGNQIGGNHQNNGNVISGNERYGIYLMHAPTRQNTIAYNTIGTDVTGTVETGNQSGGIFAQNAKDNMIGPHNTIAFNQGPGIEVNGSEATGNTITQNSIHHNTGEGIILSAGGNLQIASPVITAAGSIYGSVSAGSSIEIFSGPDDEGMTYEHTVTVDEQGRFYWEGAPAGPYVTATVTDTSGNTSAFSEAYLLTGVENGKRGTPGHFELFQNNPNPLIQS